MLQCDAIVKFATCHLRLDIETLEQNPAGGL
jgi:hypothetical protein